MNFEQYAHLAVFPKFRRSHTSGEAVLAGIEGIIDSLGDPKSKQRLRRELDRALGKLRVQDEVSAALKAQMPEEALLKIDITVSEKRQTGLPFLHAGFSSKWSLRTDRAQDCVSQGTKLVAQRRGRMPHFAVVTMEPRPAMLKILGDGSGAIDCVYHLDLPSLSSAIKEVAVKESKRVEWSPLRTFQRLKDQRRIRDYDDLVEEVLRAPEVRSS
ncbi:NgoMIV family type II restriction endonuclease [Kineococcus sp. R86509]|uniref:NgoMIV family type II restriction endonuclease n=1 Tax=Kineococcus sp. R86509 TaxID=3093851 RepID=UPI0036D3D8A0